jgi:hypothetical protein
MRLDVGPATVPAKDGSLGGLPYFHIRDVRGFISCLIVFFPPIAIYLLFHIVDDKVEHQT